MSHFDFAKIRTLLKVRNVNRRFMCVARPVVFLCCPLVFDTKEPNLLSPETVNGNPPLDLPAFHVHFCAETFGSGSGEGSGEPEKCRIHRAVKMVHLTLLLALHSVLVWCKDPSHEAELAASALELLGWGGGCFRFSGV